MKQLLIKVQCPNSIPPAGVVANKQNRKISVLRNPLYYNRIERPFHFPNHKKPEKRIDKNVMFRFNYQRINLNITNNTRKKTV